MSTRTSSIRFAGALVVAFIVPGLAHADRTPSPAQIEAAPPPAPPSPDAAPAKVEANTETKTAVKTDPKTDPKPAAKPEPAKAEGGMCSVGAPAGGWELLVLAVFGLRARRRRG